MLTVSLNAFFFLMHDYFEVEMGHKISFIDLLKRFS